MSAGVLFYPIATLRDEKVFGQTNIRIGFILTRSAEASIMNREMGGGG
jgi:hypothetical protein